MWKPIYNPGSWQQYLKRKDNKNLPLMEVRKKYLEEQLYWNNTLNSKIPLTDDLKITYNWPQSVRSDEDDFIYNYVRLDTPNWFEEIVEPGGSNVFSYVPLWYNVEDNNEIWVYRYSSGQAEGVSPHWRWETIYIDGDGSWLSTELVATKQGDEGTPLGKYKYEDGGGIAATLTEDEPPLFTDYICLTNIPSASFYHSLRKATLEGSSSLYNGVPYYTSSFEQKDYGIFFDIFKSSNNLAPYWYLGSRDEDPTPILSPEDDYTTFISWSSDLDSVRDPIFTLTPKGDDDGKVDISLEYCVDNIVPEGSETYKFGSTLFIAHVSETEADSINADVDYDFFGSYIASWEDDDAGKIPGRIQRLTAQSLKSQSSLQNTGSNNINTSYTSDDFYATVVSWVGVTGTSENRVKLPIYMTTGSITIYWGDGEVDTLSGDNEVIIHTYPDIRDKAWPLVIKGNCESLQFIESDQYNGGVYASTIYGASLQIIYQWGTVCERASLQPQRMNKFSYMKEPMPIDANLSRPGKWGLGGSDGGLFHDWYLNSSFSEYQPTIEYPVDVSNWVFDTPIMISGLFSRAQNGLKVKGFGEWNATPTNFNSGFSGIGNHLIVSESFSGWDLSQCTSMIYTFNNTNGTHIHDIEGWDTSNVTNFLNCFSGYSNKSHDLSGWYITSALNNPSTTTLNNMFTNSSFTSTHLSAILVSWKNQVDTLGFTGVKSVGQLPVAYSSLSVDAQNAVTYLVGTLGWSISYS